MHNIWFYFVNDCYIIVASYLILNFCEVDPCISTFSFLPILSWYFMYRLWWFLMHPLVLHNKAEYCKKNLKRESWICMVDVMFFPQVWFYWLGSVLLTGNPCLWIHSHSKLIHRFKNCQMIFFFCSVSMTCYITHCCASHDTLGYKESCQLWLGYKHCSTKRRDIRTVLLAGVKFMVFTKSVW